MPQKSAVKWQQKYFRIIDFKLYTSINLGGNKETHMKLENKIVFLNSNL